MHIRQRYLGSPGFAFSSIMKVIIATLWVGRVISEITKVAIALKTFAASLEWEGFDMTSCSFLRTKKDNGLLGDLLCDSKHPLGHRVYI